MADRNPVAEQSARWKQLEQLRNIIAPLWGGTLEMRTRSDLMPPHEGELVVLPRPANEIGVAPEVIRDRGGISRSYQIRLDRSVLWPEFRRQMTVLTGKVFRKPVTLGKDVPPRLVAYAEDIDRRGTNLHNFALNRFLRSMRDGFSMILVDAPRAKIEAGDDARRRTAAEEAAGGIRPYLVPYDACQLIGCRSEVVNGRWRLTQARLYERSLEPVGEFGEREVERVRVLSSPATGTVFSETWRMLTGVEDDYKLELPRAPISNVWEIPLVAVYGNWEHGFFDAEPAFIDLALFNVRDWQISSDIDNILRVGIVPKPYITGVPAGTLKDQLWSVDDMLELQDPQAKIAFAEIEGHGVKLAIENRNDGRQLMKQLGLELLLPMRSGQMTDDEVQARSTDALSPLQALALGLQDSLEQALRFMAQYHRLGNDAGGSVAVSTKPFLTATETADLQALLAARKERIITKATYGKELQRRAVLSDEIDMEAEVAAAEREALPESLLTGRLDDQGDAPENPDDDPGEATEGGDGAADRGPGAGSAAA